MRIFQAAIAIDDEQTGRVLRLYWAQRDIALR